tara:strand:+ start:333 stop:1202 length:870 start_codon:yes stop_codon:yes gene_type:complete
MIKTIRYFFEALIIYFLYIISFFIGLKYSRIFFSYLFQKIGFYFRSEKLIIKNLDKINSSMDENLKEIIIKKMWSNYGKTFIEYIFLKNFKQSNNHIKIKNKNYLETTLLGNEPVIFISGHFANFELMSMELTKMNIKLATIYRPLNNFFLNPFMEYLRKKYVCKNQIKKGIKGVKEAINYLINKNSIALMVDQRVSEGARVNFFGTPAHTTFLPAQLALKFKCQIIPIYINRTFDDKFEVEILKPITFKHPNNRDKDKVEITNEINTVLEKMVAQDPSQWILTHNRWK